jgi:hypothetical protein
LRAGAVSAADVAREVREMSLDAGECYRVRDLTLPKDEARIFLTDGYLIFAKPVAGVRMSAVFTADVEGGDAEVLCCRPIAASGGRWHPTQARRTWTSIWRPRY